MANWEIITRQAAGLRPPRAREFFSDPHYTIYHHTTGQTLGHKDLAQWWRQIQAFHMDSRGWNDIAYNFGVGWDANDEVARVFEGRGFGVVGGHTQGYNRNHAIVLMGNGDVLPPDPCLWAIAWLTGIIEQRYGQVTRIVHSDVGGTHCPGDEFRSWIHAGMMLGEVEMADPVVKVGSPVVGCAWHPTGKYLTVVTARGESVNLVADESAEQSGDDSYVGRVVFDGDMNAW